MNIFYLDSNNKTAAQYHNDKHVVKMILESAQMLSTAHRVFGDNDDSLYKIAHKNHPSTAWVRQSADNYRWLYDLFVHLCDEYTHRYGKVHKTDTRLRERLRYAPVNLPSHGFTPPPQCMPEEYKDKDDTVRAYRNYYMGEKNSFAVWSKRKTPRWWGYDTARLVIIDDSKLSSAVLLEDWLETSMKSSTYAETYLSSRTQESLIPLHNQSLGEELFS